MPNATFCFCNFLQNKSTASSKKWVFTETATSQKASQAEEKDLNKWMGWLIYQLFASADK